VGLAGCYENSFLRIKLKNDGVAGLASKKATLKTGKIRNGLKFLPKSLFSLYLRRTVPLDHSRSFLAINSLRLHDQN